MKKIFFLTVFFLLSTCIFGQKQDSLAKYTIKQLETKARLATDANINSVPYCKEILRQNPSDSIAFLAYYYMGFQAFNREGDLEKAILYLNKSLGFARKTHNQESINIALGALANAYAMQNNFKETIWCIDELKKAKPTLKINNDISYIYYLMGNFNKAIRFSIKSIDEVDSNSKNDPAEKALENQLKSSYYNSIIMSYCYLKQLDSVNYYFQKIKLLNKNHPALWYEETFYLILKGQYQEALDKIAASKKHIENSPIDLFQARYYQAVCYQKMRDFEQSLQYAELAIKDKVFIPSFLNFELELYKLAAEDAKLLGNTAKYNLYSQKYSEGAQKINYQAKAEFMAKLYDIDVVAPLAFEVKKKDSKINYLYYGLGFLVLISGGYVGFSIYTTKRDKKRFLEIIEALENKEKNQAIIKEEEKKEIEDQLAQATENNIIMNSKAPMGTKTIAEETEKKILKQLENFEKNATFKSPDITLSTIATSFNVNASYVTNTIKKHKNTNLNGYLNRLRIDYITRQLKTRPEYANFKIEYLAIDCGIVSYSTFVRVFKQETGLTPSKFLEFLNQDRKNIPT